jgi:hypothetical protein
MAGKGNFRRKGWQSPFPIAKGKTGKVPQNNESPNGTHSAGAALNHPFGAARKLGKESLPNERKQTKMKLVNEMVKLIVSADAGYAKVITLAPSLRKAKVKPEELREALKAKWGFDTMAKGSKEYNATKVRVSYWVGVVFPSTGAESGKTPALKKGLQSKVVAVLEELNIIDKKEQREQLRLLAAKLK